MGFNWIGFVQRDKAQKLAESPKTLAAGFYYNYSGNSERWRQIVDSEAESNNEQKLEGLTVLNSWHANYHLYFRCTDEGVHEGKWTKIGRLPDGTKTVEVVFDRLICNGPANIAFGLNDLSDELQKCSLTVAKMIANPAPNIQSYIGYHHDQNNHPGERIHHQALESFVANPPSEIRYYVAGGNCVQQAEVYQEKKKSVVLKLFTHDEEKKDYVLQMRLKVLNKEKKLSEVKELTGISLYNLRQFINRGKISYDDRKRLEKSNLG